MHQRYSVDSFVLGGFPQGEASRFVWLLSVEFGLVLALAQNIRARESKLRYALQDFSRSRVTLVRGREYFRVTGAEGAVHVWSERQHRSREVSRRLLGHLFSTIRRLVPAAGEGERLFAIVEETAQLCTAELSDKELRALEAISQARVLHVLGYLQDRDVHRPLLTSVCTRETLSSVDPVLSSLIRDTNAALQASQL